MEPVETAMILSFEVGMWNLYADTNVLELYLPGGKVHLHVPADFEAARIDFNKPLKLRIEVPLAQP